MDVNFARAAFAKGLSAYATVDLCVTYVVDLNRVMAAVISAFDDDPQESSLDVVGRAEVLFKQPPQVIWPEIAAVRSAELAWEVVTYRVVLPLVALELEHRAPPGAVTMLRSVLSNSASYREVLKAFRIEKLYDYRNPADPSDLQQETLKGAFKQYRKERAEIATMMPSATDWPPLPFSTELQGERWEFWRRWRWPHVQGWLIQALPLLTSRFERLQEAARQERRAVWERRDAKKRGGTGGRHAKLHGTDQERASECNFDEGSESDFLCSTGASQYRTTEDRIAEREAYEQMMEASKKFAGFHRFCEARGEGKDFDEAVRVANITRQTGHNYSKFMKWFRHKSQ